MLVAATPRVPTETVTLPKTDFWPTAETVSEPTVIEAVPVTFDPTALVGKRDLLVKKSKASGPPRNQEGSTAGTASYLVRSAIAQPVITAEVPGVTSMCMNGVVAVELNPAVAPGAAAMSPRPVEVVPCAFT